MATSPQDLTKPQPRLHVPARQVLLSAAALWLTYFVLITLRGLVVDFGEFYELLWRRALVTLAGILITLLVWPVLRRFDGRSGAVRIAAALVIMLPAAMTLAVINQRCFAPLQTKQIEQQVRKVQQAAEAAATARETAARAGQVDTKAGQLEEDAESNATKLSDKRAGIRIRHDISGNVLVEVSDLQAPVAPPEPPRRPETAASMNSVGTPGLTNKQMSNAQILGWTVDEGLWLQLTDIALGRYFLLIAWAALYVALGNAEVARASERREGEYKRAAKAAELRSLRYQVNPHFLFNTLNSLSALVMVGRAEQAERMIQSISRFYRHSLAGDPTQDMPLADEIALQRHYLDIEAVRFPERLKCEFDVPDDLMSACVPGMILQPLVENSIKYAVSATIRPVTVRISAREAGGFLILTVADDGPGEGFVGGGTGIGLGNVRSRLAARFGESEAKVESGSLPAGGYATVLTMPLVRKEC
ncbi:histidine kinase [Novosphingobium sp. AAP83]|uniref:histidine kinase n=1 Tax=Novosphingobium sp. AAP83 TaxID=1523425 RepID=UPI0006B8B942|nr:histidine kinase [Novosphingobium sp. AAP83]KPF92725.1 histidine kinase [Novosphingobium sp. AAP83]